MLDEQMKDDRFRNFAILLYEESIHYVFDEVMFILRGFKYYAYIKHEPESDEKQSHYHIVLHLDNACTISSISNRLGIPVNMIQPIRNLRSSCRYLTHIDYPDKIQYEFGNVKISRLFERKFKKFFEDLKTEEEIIYDIYNFIDNISVDSYYKCLQYLVIYVNKNCYDTIFRRYRNEFLDYLKAHF